MDQGRFAINRKDKNDKYHRILEAANAVFAKNGFFQATISQIAKNAGVADGTIYLYFKNKDDILVQIFGSKTKQVFERFNKEVEKADNAIDRLRNLIKIHLTVFQNDFNMAVVYQVETRRRNRIVEKEVKAMSKMYLDMVGEIVEQGQEEGAIRKDLYMGLVRRFILGAVDDVINTWVHAGGQYDMVSMTDSLIDLIVRGIGEVNT